MGFSKSLKPTYPLLTNDTTNIYSMQEKALDKYIEFKLELLRRYPTCEVCGWRPATDVGHCLYHKHGGIYDSFENCQSNCNICNTGYGSNANSRQAKINHWKKRKAEGYDMEKWNNLVPKYRREYFE